MTFAATAQPGTVSANLQAERLTSLDTGDTQKITAAIQLVSAEIISRAEARKALGFEED